MTTLVETPTEISARTSTQYFYFYMALSCTAVAFLGFAPTYWLPMAARTLSRARSSTFTDWYFSAGHCSFASRPGSPRREGSPFDRHGRNILCNRDDHLRGAGKHQPDEDRGGDGAQGRR